MFYLGRYQEALESVDRALMANPNYSNASLNRSLVLAQLNNSFDHEDFVLK